MELIFDFKAAIDYMEGAYRKRAEEKKVSLQLRLAKALSDCPSHWVDAICRSWGLPVKGTKRDKAAALASKLGNVAELEKGLASLPPASLQAITFLLEEGGWSKIAALTRRFGKDDGDGFFWLTKPPQSPLGRLRLRGLCFLGRADREGRSYKVAVVPVELRSPLATALSLEAPPKTVQPAAKKTKAAQKNPVPIVCQLKVTLQDVNPPVWRRIQVPGSCDLSVLHLILQKVMGWENDHLYDFQFGREHYGEPDPKDGFWGARVHDAVRTTLSQVLPTARRKLVYLYDFGDSWEHLIQLEKTLPRTEENATPVCLAGEGACPPEDCGGAWGYARLLEIAKDPDHPEYEETMEWLGENRLSRPFSPEAATARLKPLTRLVSGKRGVENARLILRKS